MLIKIDDDFSLEKIVNSGQCFRPQRITDAWFRFVHEGHILHIRPAEPGFFEVDADEATWRAVWFPYFDLNRNYRLLRQGIDPKDTFMRKAAEEAAGIRILRQDPWEMLISFIISQRKSIPAIRSCVQQLSERFGTKRETAFGPVWCFPTGAQLSEATEDALRECKLGYRVPFVRDAIEQVLCGKVNLNALYACNDEDTIASLLRIRGVGIKVASCVALFAYGQTTAAPVDTWIRKVIAREYGGVNPFAQYGDQAGIMQQYAFCYALNHKAAYADVKT